MVFGPCSKPANGIFWVRHMAPSRFNKEGRGGVRTTTERGLKNSERYGERKKDFKRRDFEDKGEVGQLLTCQVCGQANVTVKPKEVRGYKLGGFSAINGLMIDTCDSCQAGVNSGRVDIRKMFTDLKITPIGDGLKLFDTDRRVSGAQTSYQDKLAAVAVKTEGENIYEKLRRNMESNGLL